MKVCCFSLFHVIVKYIIEVNHCEHLRCWTADGINARKLMLLSRALGTCERQKWLFKINYITWLYSVRMCVHNQLKQQFQTQLCVQLGVFKLLCHTMHLSDTLFSEVERVCRICVSSCFACLISSGTTTLPSSTQMCLQVSSLPYSQASWQTYSTPQSHSREQTCAFRLVFK